MEGEAVTTDFDIYLSANILVKRHGTEAPIEAAMHADAMLGRGDLAPRNRWHPTNGNIRRYG